MIRTFISEAVWLQNPDHICTATYAKLQMCWRSQMCGIVTGII